jgi:hypothetical protein
MIYRGRFDCGGGVGVGVLEVASLCNIFVVCVDTVLVGFIDDEV